MTMPCEECRRLREQLARWQAVAHIDGADVVAQARAEGVNVENPKELHLWLSDFYQHPSASGGSKWRHVAWRS